MPDLSLWPMVALAPLLVWVAASDLRYLKITNLQVGVAAAGFVVAVISLPMPDLWARLLVAGVVFALGLVGFALRMFGGGDVKFLPVLMLYVPLQDLGIFLNLFSAALILGIAAVLGLRRVPAVAGLGWKSMGPSRNMPMGLSIALAGLALPWVSAALN